MSLFTSALAATRRPGRLLRALARWAVGLMLLAWGLVLVACVFHWNAQCCGRAHLGKELADER